MKKNLVRCEECGGEMKNGSIYRWNDPFLGSLQINAFPDDYLFCPECSCEILSYALMKRIEQEEQEQTEQLLLLSVNGSMKRYKENLIQNKDLVQYLGKSRQAIQQDGRIKTLIFHHVEKSGQILFWKKSVELYKICGDGRFKLYTEEKTCSSAKNMVPLKFKIDSSRPHDSIFSRTYEYPSQEFNMAESSVADIKEN